MWEQVSELPSFPRLFLKLSHINLHSLLWFLSCPLPGLLGAGGTGFNYSKKEKREAWSPGTPRADHLEEWLQESWPASTL